MVELHTPDKKPDNEATSTNHGHVKEAINGIVIGGVFMAPRVDETPDITAEIERKIRTHQS